MIAAVKIALRGAGVNLKQVQSCPRLSTSVMENEVTPKPTIVNISPVLRLHKFTQDNENTPLTILLPWATATERSLDRFRSLYAERGFNVLTAYAKPINFIWPASSRPVTAEIMDYLRSETGSAPIVVHAFSIGAFMYANLLLRVLDQRQEFAEFQPRIRGQVFDSIVIGSLKEMRVGTAKMLSRTWLIQQFILRSSALYFLLTRRHTVAVYDRLLDAFWKNPFETPILLFYSLQDPMCKEGAVEDFAQDWEERTHRRAYCNSFPDPKHAQILRSYPEEYRDTLFRYLDTLQIGNQRCSRGLQSNL